MEKKRKKSLPRIGVEQINNARKILVHAAKNDKVIDYDQYSQDFVEACGVNVETSDEAKKYFSRLSPSQLAESIRLVMYLANLIAINLKLDKNDC